MDLRVYFIFFIKLLTHQTLFVSLMVESDHPTYFGVGLWLRDTDVAGDPFDSSEI